MIVTLGPGEEIIQEVCQAKAGHGGRCRNPAFQDGLCVTHHSLREKIERIGLPGAIILRFPLKDELAQVLKYLVAVLKTKDTYTESDEKHLKQAEKIGREPFRYRSHLPHQAADSGVPVIVLPCADAHLSLRNAWQELKESDYRITGVHLKPSRDGRKNLLVVALSKKTEQMILSEHLLAIISSLVDSCWNRCGVWSNPPQNDGRIIDTINVSNRQEGGVIEKYLCFANGIWQVR